MQRTKLKRLKVFGWRQYKYIDIEFHPRLTILTGSNASGKSTLLNIVNRHLSSYGGSSYTWSSIQVGTPQLITSGPGAGGTAYLPDYWKPFYRKGVAPKPEESPATVHDAFWADYQDPTEPVQEIGAIDYTDSDHALITVHSVVGRIYTLNISGQREVLGIPIPAYRPPFSYKAFPSDAFSFKPKDRRTIRDDYIKGLACLYKGEEPVFLPGSFIKDVLISSAILGSGMGPVPVDRGSLDLLRAFETIMGQVLPRSLGFIALEFQDFEIMLRTKSGNFLLDGVSGGLASIISIAWLLFLVASDDLPLTVTFDEPENHLHPEMQKTIIPSLMAAFPKIQFIVSTHSPFVACSVADSSVYALKYDESGTVESHRLDFIEKAGTANEILRDVLGLDNTFPLWVEDKLNSILGEFKGKDITQDSLTKLIDRLNEVGLGKYIPPSLDEILEERSTND